MAATDRRGLFFACVETLVAVLPDAVVGDDMAERRFEETIF